MGLKSGRLSRLVIISILPLGVVFFYILPSAITYLLRGAPYSAEIMKISVISVIFYIFVWVAKLDVIAFYPLYNIRKKEVDFLKASKLIAIAYFCFIAYVACTAPSIPLFDALSGGEIDVISSGRETFLRTRVGWEVSLNYIYAIFRSVLMPFAICYLYSRHHKYRHWLLVGFLFTLMLTLEKSLSIIAILPVAFILFQHKPRAAVKVLASMVFCVMATSFLARGGAAGDQSDSSLSAVPDGYSIFNDGSQVSYILNRIIYIPYVTSVDWLRYRDVVLDGENASGRSISVVAWAMNEKKLNLEREVFAFQWGQNETGTGSANTAYFVDAYVNFGVLGIFAYTLIIALVVRLVIVSKVYVMRACIFVPLIYLSFNSLSAMIFSGGLFVIVFFSVFLRDRAVGG